MTKYVVSACLVGVNCRFDGKSQINPQAAALVKKGLALPLCPEQLGGLATPRSRAEIRGGDGQAVLEAKARVITIEGKDVTKEFLKGGQETWKLAQIWGATKAILKSKSPSCGNSFIYDGTFAKRLQKGMGVTAALLRENDIEILSECQGIDP